MDILLLDFQQLVADSGLMTAVELQAFIDSLPEEEKPLDANGLARALVREHRLTPYQAQAIYQGKGPQLTLGNYIILSQLGKGGMGVVFKATHRRMQRVVAIKVLTRTSVKEPALVERFKREVRAAGLLEHPNIVTAYDADEAAGRLFLVMQYIAGDDLSSLVKNRGPLPLSMAISCIRQAARGLEYAHNRGVVHRDIKPSNLILGHDGTLKILDLGLARIEPHVDCRQEGDLTSTGLVMGSVDFMAPEQAADMRKSDARSDVYSLGCTLWYLLVGKPIYPGTSPMERLVAHWEKPLPSLQELCPEVSPALEAVIHKMVAKHPENRYQTMAEVITDLERARTSEAAATSHPPRDEGSLQDEELQEFLQVFADGAFDSNADNQPPRGKRRTDSSSGRRSSHDTASRSSRTLRGAAAAGSHRRYLTPGRLAWIGASGLVATLLIAGILARPREEGGGTREPTEPAKKSIAGPPVPRAGKDCVELVDDALSHWRPSDAWSIQTVQGQRVLTCQGASSAPLLSLKDDYTDYTLWLDYQLSEGADSGVFVRGRFTEQVQLADDTSLRRIPAERTGALWNIEPPDDSISLKPDYKPYDWHELVVQVQGKRVRIWIDQKIVNDVQLERLAARGYVGLEGVEGATQQVWFRNVRIKLEKPLEAGAAKPESANR